MCQSSIYRARLPTYKSFYQTISLINDWVVLACFYVVDVIKQVRGILTYLVVKCNMLNPHTEYNKFLGSKQTRWTTIKFLYTMVAKGC